MQKVYYTRMKIASSAVISVALPLTMFILSAKPPASAQQQSASKPITTASLDSHEGLTIAADPWLSAERYQQAFPKKSPYAAGILAIKVTLRNDSAESIRVDIERIRLNLTFDDNNRQELPGLTSEQLADAVLHPRVKSPSKPRIPLPLPSSSGGRDKNWEQFQKLAEDNGLHASILAPHSTTEGLLYFDLQNQFDLLANARLYIPNLFALEKNQALMYFDIDLSRPGSR
ncbi:MAG TPA: hypothetical protein VFR42_04420 [Candidatus Acidoferrum sp.]|nr:hypothetical protein [Candidatus Acidoferrum sp.]